MSKRWKCCILNDATGEPYMVGTNGDTLRIRRPGILPIEIELKDCQHTPKHQFPQADIDFDPMFKSNDELKVFMEEQREANEAAKKASGKFNLRQSIHAGLTNKEWPK